MFGLRGQRLWLAVLVVGLLLASGVGDRRVWAQSSGGGAPPAMRPATDSLAGKWRGTWLSGSTGHKGPMQADFRSAGAGRWEVVFRGRFCALIPFQYSAVLRESRTADGSLQLNGSKNLGPLFGTFHFNGSVEDGQLDARWWSQKESGRFVLRQ